MLASSAHHKSTTSIQNYHSEPFPVRLLLLQTRSWGKLAKLEQELEISILEALYLNPWGPRDAMIVKVVLI